MRACALAGLAAGVLIVAPASAQAPRLPELPAPLRPTGLSAYLEVSATGVQIYTCGRNDAGAWTWMFKAPEAALLDAQQTQIGKHYAGPSWEGMQGGKIVGAVKGNAPAPTAGAIPWLLLDVTSREGSSVFTQAKGVLRISTNGGGAPAQGCDEAHASQEARVPYTATYVFLK
jgi:hypothetical protein